MKKFLFLVALTIAMVSCKPEIEEPTVVTKSVKEITESTAKVEGQVAADGGAEVTERGVCWNTDGMPTVLDYRVKDAEVGLGTFASNIIDLEANTTYYVRAYAINEVGTSYGEEKSFTTREMVNPDPDDPETPENPDEPEIPSYEWVDLGLSVKWATCNVGASSPEEYGNYYAWGEIETKDEYLESNSLTYGLCMSELESLGYIDSEGNLTTSYDVATANWGEGWRMPTYDEIKELYDNCDMTWTILNGITGCYFTGPSGKSIFLPAAGNFDSESYDVGREGYYWSATPNDADNSDDGTAPGHYAFHLCFDDDEYCSDFDGGYRSDGYSVRPVFE